MALCRPLGRLHIILHLPKGIRRVASCGLAKKRGRYSERSLKSYPLNWKMVTLLCVKRLGRMSTSSAQSLHDAVYLRTLIVRMKATKDTRTQVERLGCHVNQNSAD